MGYIRKIKHLFARPIQFDQISVEPLHRDFGYHSGTPIDRYYIESFLKLHADVIRGVSLEIGESTYSKVLGHDIEKCEILHYDNSNKQATIIGDLTKVETLPSNSIDCFICTQTYNFIYDLQKAIEGSYQVLKPQGVLLGTVAGLTQISRYDMDRWGDYWRFTDRSIKKLLEEVFGQGNVEVQVYGNVFAATALLKGVVCEDIEDLQILNHKDADYQVTIGFKAIKNV
ncbi:MAG: methyltransferase domain-containing protein [Bacteroidales bacterium]